MASQQEETFITAFYDPDGMMLGNFQGLLPLPLYKGMKVKIHSYTDLFEVLCWEFHLGQADEGAGLHIYVKAT